MKNQQRITEKCNKLSLTKIMIVEVLITKNGKQQFNQGIYKKQEKRNVTINARIRNIVLVQITF